MADRELWPAPPWGAGAATRLKGGGDLILEAKGQVTIFSYQLKLLLASITDSLLCLLLRDSYFNPWFENAGAKLQRLGQDNTVLLTTSLSTGCFLTKNKIKFQWDLNSASLCVPSPAFFGLYTLCLAAHL